MAISQETRAKMSASAKAAKARLKADPVAYQQFRERTSKAVKKQTALRSGTTPPLQSS